MLAQAVVAIAAAAVTASYALAIGVVAPAPISRHVATPEAMLVRALLDIRDLVMRQSLHQPVCGTRRRSRVPKP